jgi:hypothetical protein
MDYSKLDAGLAAALEDASEGTQKSPTSPRRGGAAAPGGLSVFVHLDPQLSRAEKAKLAELGLPIGSAQGGIATATLSPEQVGQLSEQPSVRQLRLSTPLRLLGNDQL